MQGAGKWPALFHYAVSGGVVLIEFFIEPGNGIVPSHRFLQFLDVYKRQCLRSMGGSRLYGFSLMCFLHFAFRCRSLRKGFLPHFCGVFRRWHAPHSFGTSCPEVTSGQSVQKLAPCGASPAGVFRCV